MFKPAAVGTDMPDMDTGMSRIQMMSSVSVPIISVSVYPAGFTYPCQTLVSNEKMRKKKKNLLLAQTMCLASFGLVFVAATFHR